MKTKIFLFLSLFLTGCEGCKIDFAITISNRTKAPIEAYAAGENLGVVSGNSVQNFTVEASPENGPSSYSNDYVQVDFVFRNINTGKTSRVFQHTLRENKTETIEVRESDFLY